MVCVELLAGRLERAGTRAMTIVLECICGLLVLTALGVRPGAEGSEGDEAAFCGFDFGVGRWLDVGGGRS